MKETNLNTGVRELDTTAQPGETQEQRAERLTEAYEPHDADEAEALKDPEYAAYRKQLRASGDYSLDIVIPPAV